MNNDIYLAKKNPLVKIRTSKRFSGDIDYNMTRNDIPVQKEPYKWLDYQYFMVLMLILFYFGYLVVSYLFF